jgi:hypothetical protein
VRAALEVNGLAPESFEAVFGQLVFQNTTARNQARNALDKYAARNNYTPPTITDVAAGKYGAGPALLVTLRLDARADADEAWSDGVAMTANLRATSILRQSSVVFDATEGTQTVTEIHKLTVPPDPGDF